jgi:hypothetical protein
MEVSGQLHPWAALIPRKEFPVLTEQEAELAPRTSLKCCGEEKTSYSCQNVNSTPRLSSPVDPSVSWVGYSLQNIDMPCCRRPPDSFNLAPSKRQKSKRATWIRFSV